MDDPFRDIRDIELRFIISTDMSDEKLDEFCNEIEVEIKEHLIDGENVLCSLHTDKISYKGAQLLKEKGEQ